MARMVRFIFPYGLIESTRLASQKMLLEMTKHTVPTVQNEDPPKMETGLATTGHSIYLVEEKKTGNVPSSRNSCQLLSWPTSN